MGNELVKNDVPVSGGMVQFHSTHDMIMFAEEVFRSGLAPSGFKTPQAIFVAVQQGAELGLRPMQSLQGIAVINGKTSLYDKTARGIAIASKLVDSLEDRFEGSNDDLVAICIIKRKGVQNPFVGRFSVADAKRAGLWGKAGPWSQYSKDMLAHKASSRALNAGFADVLIGLPVFEDIQDLPPEKKPERNPNPTLDPLLSDFKEANAGVENDSNIPTANLDGQHISDAQEYSPSPASAHESNEGMSDDQDYQASQAEVKNENQNRSNLQVAPQAPAGASEVIGEVDSVFPATGKGPTNIIIKGLKIALWPKRFAKENTYFCSVWKKGCSKKFNANYTTAKSGDQGQYTNHTLVAIQSI